MVSEAVGFEAFFRAEHPKLVALALAMVGDREVARELAQEALVRAYRSWSTVGGYDVPGAWVRRVLINLVADRGRRAASERRALDRLPPPPPYEAPDPIDAQWRDAVRSLPDRQRAVMALHRRADGECPRFLRREQRAPGRWPPVRRRQWHDRRGVERW